MFSPVILFGPLSFFLLLCRRCCGSKPTLSIRDPDLLDNYDPKGGILISWSMILIPKNIPIPIRILRNTTRLLLPKTISSCFSNKYLIFLRDPIRLKIWIPLMRIWIIHYPQKESELPDHLFGESTHFLSRLDRRGHTAKVAARFPCGKVCTAQRVISTLSFLCIHSRSCGTEIDQIELEVPPARDPVELLTQLHPCWVSHRALVMLDSLA